MTSPITRRMVVSSAEWDLLQSYGAAAEAPVLAPTSGPTIADAVTLTGYGLGVWWAAGGPSWSGVASLVADEVDGRLARWTGTATPHGALLDWGGDVALTPFALGRLGREVGHEGVALAAAPPLLAIQVGMKSRGMRPRVGSARAVITVAAILVHEWRRRT